MGGHYPAGGINIGPAMAFGYIAGRDLAGVDMAPAATADASSGTASDWPAPGYREPGVIVRVNRRRRSGRPSIRAGPADEGDHNRGQKHPPIQLPLAADELCTDPQPELETAEVELAGIRTGVGHPS